ncbi:hypothetical protein BC830DRAFT_1113250 [Chytriomyces sp. MP71]|nr:hypothetical protein BC830DRAFT_1113250 [Chytriomyces sp. MP71]
MLISLFFLSVLIGFRRLSRSREFAGNLQYSNISPPSSFLAAKAFDQLAVLLSESALQTSQTQPQKEPSHEDTPGTPNSIGAFSYQQQQTPLFKSMSVPSSRRTSSMNLGAPSSVPSSAPAPPHINPLPRHTSDPMLYATSPSLNSPSNERELRRRVVKQCLEIKRILDKECNSGFGSIGSNGNTTMALSGATGPALIVDSPLHKIFFSKSSHASGVSVLLKCIKVIPDVDICIIVTNLLLRVVSTNGSTNSCSTSGTGTSSHVNGSMDTLSASSANSNIAFLARKNASLALVTCLVGIVNAHAAILMHVSSGTGTIKKKVAEGSSGSAGNRLTGTSAASKNKATGSGTSPVGLPSGVPSLSARIEEAIQNIFSVLVKLGKHDTKLPVLARIHGCVEVATDIVKKWLDRKESITCLLGLQVLKVLAVKNESNIAIMHKRGILESVWSFFKSTSLGSSLKDSRENQAFEVALDLLTIFAKHDSVVTHIISLFGIQYFLGLFNCISGCDTIRKAILKLLRVMVETAPGRKEFNTTDGIEVLTSSLEEIMQQHDISISFTSNTTNTIPSLLVAVLRSAVAEADLPYIDHIQHRYFTIAPHQSKVRSDDSPPICRASQRATPIFSDPKGTVTDLMLAEEKSRDSSPMATPSQPQKKAGSKLSKQNSVSQLSIPSVESNQLLIPSRTPEEEAYLEKLCPELKIFGEIPPPVLDIPTRVLKSVYPTNFDIPGIPIILIRDPDDYKPTLKLPIQSLSNGNTGTSVAASQSFSAAPSSQRIRTYNSPTPKEVEPQCKKSNAMMRKTVYEQTSRILRPGMYANVIVYDVMDESVQLHVQNDNPDALKFESRFECGNLQLAIKVQETEYDLILQSDIGSKPGRHNQWFFFSVTNMTPSVSYKFNIINMSKGSSQFGEGMQPVIYSVKEQLWRRSGDSVCFYKNHYRKPEGSKSEESAPVQSKGSAVPTYSTLTFHVKSPHQCDTLYIAYHYPYTVSDLTLFLDSLQVGDLDTPITERPCDKFNSRCRRQGLCSSVGGNKIELLTITALDQDSLRDFPIQDRTYIFLTCRVHPGESNSSYIMHGALQFLLGDEESADHLRKKCVFKIVPMLNPDGVIAGSHRCGLAGTDLNRAWQQPCPIKTPSIYWTKMLWRYLVDMGKRPLLSCDFHGHSRKKNVFIFGCENGIGINEGIEKIFPSLLATLSPVFDQSNCKYSVEKTKESTARVVMWREMGVVGSYTLESSYCGADVGEKKGLQLQIPDLEKVGVDFCCAIWALLGIFDSRIPVATPPSKKEKIVVPQNGGAGAGGAESDSSCDEK